MRRVLPLIGATLLIAGGAFCAWQAWLIADESDAAERTRLAQRQAVHDLGDLYATRHSQLMRAVTDPQVAAGIDDHAATAARLRALLPNTSNIEIYSGGLDEVVRANYREFGYAKAAQLMAALGATAAPLASSSVHGSERRLTVAEPVNADGAVRAWVWLEYPFDDIRQKFMASSPSSGRLELRQGNGGDSLMLEAVGSSSGELSPDGQ
ncbi:hypothetical protein Y883_20885, partial [Luteibacter rhizovicinus DSM 16549]